MKLTPQELQIISSTARANAIEAATLMAVVEVESNGQTYTVLDGQKLPLIRIEGHYFDRLVPRHLQKEARALGLASPTMGAVKNPSSQAARYKMLARMMKLDRDAAIMSCSWGVGQVMGSHWDWLGYASAVDFYQKVTGSVIGQIEAMVRYIQKAGLMDELQRHDWSAFARGYNGPAYARFGYHTKLEAAYERHSGRASPSAGAASGLVRMGSKGMAVREIQTLLVRSGATLKVDGDFGPATRDAVKDFQRTNRLKVDGIVGPKTLASLNRFRVDPEEAVGKVAIVDNEKVREGVLSAGGGITAVVAADKVTEMADRIGVTGLNAIDYAVSGLYAVSAVLVIGGLAWSVYGHFKTKQTFEGTA